MGKGDTYRPVNREKYDKHYEEIFHPRCPKCNAIMKKKPGVPGHFYCRNILCSEFGKLKEF